MVVTGQGIVVYASDKTWDKTNMMCQIASNSAYMQHLHISKRPID